MVQNITAFRDWINMLLMLRNRERDGQEDNTRGIKLRQIKSSRRTVIAGEASIEKVGPASSRS